MSFNYRNFPLDDSQLLLGSSKLGIGLYQGFALGLHITINLVELNNIYHPSTQPCKILIDIKIIIV